MSRTTIGAALRALGIMVLLAAAGGCGHVDSGGGDGDAGSTTDAASVVDAARPIDASVPIPPPSDVAEMVSAGGHVSGGGYQIDLQLGHWRAQSPAGGNGTTVSGAAAVKR